MATKKTGVQSRIAEGISKNAALAATAKAVPAKAIDGIRFASTLKKLIPNHWGQLIERILDLKRGEALELDCDCVPSALKAAAVKQDVELEFSLKDGKLLVRAKSLELSDEDAA